MLHDKTGERNCKVIAQPLFAHFQGKSLAVVAVFCALNLVIVITDAGKCISGVKYPEKKLVALFTVFP